MPGTESIAQQSSQKRKQNGLDAIHLLQRLDPLKIACFLIKIGIKILFQNFFFYMGMVYRWNGLLILPT